MCDTGSARTCLVQYFRTPRSVEEVDNLKFKDLHERGKTYKKIVSNGKLVTHISQDRFGMWTDSAVRIIIELWKVG